MSFYIRIGKLMEHTDVQADLTQLCTFVNLAADKVLESGAQPIDQLKSYFSSPMGMELCEQTAFPSLVMDFMERIRIYLVQETLTNMLPLEDRSDTASPANDSGPDVERPIRFLMNCIQAVMSDPVLVDQYRCELPNLIHLTAEEYPASTLYQRDSACQALSAVPDKSFNAGLVWYLHDCNVIAKTVKIMTKYASASETNDTNASEALKAFVATNLLAADASLDTHQADLIATASAAVSDALGLNSNKNEFMAVEGASTLPLPDEDGVIRVPVKDSQTEIYCLQPYDAVLGLKALIFVLQKTCRHSLVLLSSFHSAGGYILLQRIVRNSTDRETSKLIYLFTLLLPLGTGFAGLYGEDDSMATVTTCGARNVGAFLAMRDLLLFCISELEILKDSDNLGDSMKAKNELLIVQLLTTILQVYTSDHDNFQCLEPKTQTLALILTKLPWIRCEDAKVIVLRIVEYVCGAVQSRDQLPVEIVSILCHLFVESTNTELEKFILIVPQEDQGGVHDTSKEEISSEGIEETDDEDVNKIEDTVSQISSLSLSLCGCMIKILGNTTIPDYANEFSACQVLERGIYANIVKIASFLSACTKMEEKSKYLDILNFRLSLWSLLIAAMMKHSIQICVDFRELQMHQSLYVIAENLLGGNFLDNLPKPPEFRGCYNGTSLLSIFVALSTKETRLDECSGDESPDFIILQSGIETDLTKIFELLQTFRGNTSRQCILLDVLKSMLAGRNFVWKPWKSCQGNEILIAVLSAVNVLDQSNENNAAQFQFMDGIFDIFNLILDPVSGDKQNRQHFRAEIGYSALSTCLINSGVLKTDKLPNVLNRVFELITGQSPPRNKIRNSDAVFTLFRLLPNLSIDDGVTVVYRLLSKLMSNDDPSYSRRKQIASLVQSGAFQWLSDPLIVPLFVDETPLQNPLTQWITVLAKEEMTTSQLRKLLKLLAKGMPKLLESRYLSTTQLHCVDISRQDIGLTMMENVFKGPVVPQVMVGTSVKTRMTAGYVHVVNNVDRIWPPTSGYSFACWLRFPPSSATYASISPTVTSKAYVVSDNDIASTNSPTRSEGNTVCVALCEGPIVITLDGDDTQSEESYGVLVGSSLTLFTSAETAHRNEATGATMEVTAVARNGAFVFNFWSHEKRYSAKCDSIESVEMWLRAMQQSESISNFSTKSKAVDDDMLFVVEDSRLSADTLPDDEMEGYACILSVYSVESAGCFVRIYFEQETGCLRVDTGSVSSAPNMNPNPRRTSAVFKNIDLNLLRSRGGATCIPDNNNGSDNSSYLDDGEKDYHWHHIAFTHRKAVVGSSLLTLYIDGSEVTTKKLSYPSAPSSGSVQSFIGKDIQVCGKYPAIPWSIGPAWFTEELLGLNAIVSMFILGPSFNGQFSGHAYRSVGNWSETLATSLLDRAAQRHVEISRLAKRLQLSKLARACRRQWNDSSSAAGGGTSNLSVDLPNLADTMASRKDDFTDAVRFVTGSTMRKDQAKVESFRSFLKYDCVMSSFGNEILQVLSNFKLAEDMVIFSLNTKYGIHSKTPVCLHTQLHFIGTVRSCPLDLAKVLPSVGGVTQMLFPLLDHACRPIDLNCLLKIFTLCMRRNPSCLAECLEMNGYALLASMLSTRIQLIDELVLKSIIRLAVSGSFGISLPSEISPCKKSTTYPLIVDTWALSQVILCGEIRSKLPVRFQRQLLLSFLAILDCSNPNTLFNARQMRRADFLSWILTYIWDICNEEVSLDRTAALELRWCFPSHAKSDVSELLQYLLALLSAYLRVENQVDDMNNISDLMLLSMTNERSRSKDNCFRLVLLQFLLHEIEKDTNTGNKNNGNASSDGAAEPIGPTIVDAVLYRANVVPSSKKRKEKNADGGSPAVTSPLASLNSPSTVPTFPADGFDNILLEIINQSESGSYSSIEALLSVRILLSLAQEYAIFAQYLLHFSPSLLHKFKRVIERYSTNCNFYSPLLAYVSNISIKDTKYYDPVISSSGHTQQFSLPKPCAFACSEKYCVNHVWELLGCLLLRNAKLHDEKATMVNVVVLTQLSFQTEVSETFFMTLCNSSSTIIKIIVRCLLYSPQDVNLRQDASEDGDSLPFSLHQSLSSLISGRTNKASGLPVACLDLLKVIASRSLFEKEDFAALMLFLLECLDFEVSKQTTSLYSLADVQKCWLALLVYVVKTTKALSENCSYRALRNLCTLSMVLSRYLLDESKHQPTLARTESSADLPSNDSDSVPNDGIPIIKASCFGVDVLVFFLSTVRMCTEPHITQLVGSEDQQLFYGSLVYCAQTVVLNELKGLHKDTVPSQHLLECLLNAKHSFLQQTKCSSIIVCGTLTHNDSGNSGTTTAINPGGYSGQLHRMRSISSNAHKEFAIGAESDRSFILSLAAELFRMLVDDSEHVRYVAILMWQFMIQQRMGVLKELLIVEQRSSLLQNITTNKKEVIDVYHGGFERLLNVIPPKRDASGSSQAQFSGLVSSAAELKSNRESWLQFHIWLTDHYDLLKDLLLVRTDPIYQHLADVLLSCVCIRKVNATNAASRLLSQSEMCISLEFALNFEGEQISKSASDINENEIEVGYKASARKTLVKLVNIREGSLDAMNDAHSRWQETYARLLSTRSIWQIKETTERENNLRDKLSEDKTSTPSTFASVCLERSIFQLNEFSFSLDSTEGPQRKRLRLVRNYQFDEKGGSNKEKEHSDPSHTEAAAHDHEFADPLLKCRVFHEAVEMFREFVFKMSVPSEECVHGLEILASLSRRCEFENTKTIFQRTYLIHFICALAVTNKHNVVSQTDNLDIGVPYLRNDMWNTPDTEANNTKLTVLFDDEDLRLHVDGTNALIDAEKRVFSVETSNEEMEEVKVDSRRNKALISAVARKISAFMSEGLAEADAYFAIPKHVVDEIERVLEAQESVNGDHIPVTIFDAADAEIMQSLLTTLKPSSKIHETNQTLSLLSPPRSAAIESDEEEEEEEDEFSTAGLVQNMIDEDSDDDELQESTSKQESKIHPKQAENETFEPKLTPSLDKRGSLYEGSDSIELPLAEKVGLENEEKIVDSSFDFVYGGIARFLPPEDYPPVRCYNATHISGIMNTMGIFLVCRHSIYFIGGYGKLFTSMETDSSAGVVSNPSSPTGASATQNNPFSPSKIGKKKTKDLIRNTLADISNQFVSSKSSNSQLFTVVPLDGLRSTSEVANSTGGISSNNEKALSTGFSKRWSIKYSNVKQFGRIKYQLRPVGIEFFDTFGLTYFVQYESFSEREEVIKTVFHMPIVNSVFWHPVLRSSALSLSMKRIRQAATKRWQRGQLSNFEYLIHLNTLAGRSFNDLTQYPVFPWILADYKSEFLDLESSKTYRDLSKPMGALGANRAAQFRERYNAMCTDMAHSPMDTPAFHYGTHYSCSAYVVNYLIRLEPFTTLAKELQGGCFDHADRLFRSIASSWESASTDNLQDVRELIPEFFFLPEFLYNANSFDFGTTQSGEVVSHIRLPPWAHGDPREFIRIHRRALESKHVSENLHGWIDLVFGAKQTGQAALDAQNVFMHFTYEGTVDLDQIDDPVMRNAMLAQIEYFGQTPSRIFSSPHPQRKVPILVNPSTGTGSGTSTVASAVGTSQQYEGNTINSIEAYVKWHTPLAPALVSIGKDYVFLKKQATVKLLEEPVGDVRLVNDKLQCRGFGCHFLPPGLTKYIDWVSLDGTIKFRIHQSSTRYREVNKVIGVVEGAHFNSIKCAIFSDDGVILVTGGDDATVNVLECMKINGQRVFKQLAKLVGHEDSVISVAINKVISLISFLLT